MTPEAVELPTVHRQEPASQTHREHEAGPIGPVRTCIGCRGKAAKTDLIRFVLVQGVLVPDPTGRLPGRGASLHPDPACFDLAERRRAFGRALRHPGPLDLTAAHRYVEERHR